MRAAKALAVLASAPVLIGALRVPYEAFYHSLGTSAEQVGLSTWRMTTFPLLVVLLLAATSSPAVLAGASFFLWLRRKDAEAPHSGFRGLVDTVLTVLGAVCLSYLTFAAIVFGVSHAGRVWVPIAVLLGGLVLTCAASLGHMMSADGVLGESPVDPGGQSSTTDKARLIKLWLAFFLVLIAVASAAAWSFLWLRADSAADRLREDGSTSATPFIRLLDINPIPVCVASAAATGAAPPGVPTDRPVLLLGSAGGMVVLERCEG